MNSRAVLIAQAIRGPVVLIIIGVLFAIHQAGVLPFSRTWPLIIITIGILKLIERMAMQQQQPPLPPSGGVR